MATRALCKSQQLKHLFFNPVISSLAANEALFRKPCSSCDVVCNVSGWRSASLWIFKTGRCLLPGTQWIHSGLFLKMGDKVVEQTHQSEDMAVADGSADVKKKRKKLKGKRAVVRFLKCLRWKKKKEYQRMTAEERILFKLRKARTKEERYIEALKKLEPKESSETFHDPEILTPEEHFYFLKIGIKSKNYVSVGRRGIYQGVILNMHLHWKKHQTLKVVVKTFSPEEVKEIASELARLSGGIVLDIQEENTIIMYRGKNYSQPPTEIMSPRVTLPRKKALDKSKYRESLRAVRRYIPRLEQELELLRAREDNEPKMAGGVLDSVNAENISDAPPENYEKVEDYNSTTESDMMGSDCEEDLSDIFETDSDSENQKTELPLYLDTFEKFPVQREIGEISVESSQKAKSVGKDDELPHLDEVDRLFIQAALLLKEAKK